MHVCAPGRARAGTRRCAPLHARTHAFLIRSCVRTSPTASYTGRSRLARRACDPSVPAGWQIASRGGMMPMHMHGGAPSKAATVTAGLAPGSTRSYRGSQDPSLHSPKRTYLPVSKRIESESHFRSAEILYDHELGVTSPYPYFAKKVSSRPPRTPFFFFLFFFFLSLSALFVILARMLKQIRWRWMDRI